MLAGSVPAQEQQQPGKADAVNETRQLEAEIEEYPGPTDGVTTESDTRIPEEIHPPPKKTTKARAKASSPGTAATAGTAQGRAVMSIDAREVQRVFGQDSSVLSLATLDAASVTRLQTRLRDLGHYLGEIDGVMGPKTRAALDAVIADQFRLSKRLLQQNQLTTDFANQLGLDGANSGVPTKPASTQPPTGASPPPAPAPRQGASPPSP
jgi:peptidoglycan hydrolase-like protein with peptidoglycan-binding domain